jgi:tRNA-dihydrouridine synthase B
MDIPPLRLKNLEISPPLFLAPMAGITHSAFRRLVSDFGGYGALFTEMLSGKALLHEKVGGTPFTKRRPAEGTVWYQLALSGSEDVSGVIDKLGAAAPHAIDLNAGCPAPDVRRFGAGVALFKDARLLEKVLSGLRRAWGGVLTVKCRLWKSRENWEKEFFERLRIIEACGADAVIVHPRFFDEKLKRRARWELFGRIAQATSLPLIASGDIGDIGELLAHQAEFAMVKGLMVGRQAVVRPWIFRSLSRSLFSGTLSPDAAPENHDESVDYAGVWKRYFDYVNEDFPPERAIGRLKEFTAYFSCNFFFGHQMRSAAQAAPSLAVLNEAVTGFLSSHPRTVDKPSVRGI